MLSAISANLVVILKNKMKHTYYCTLCIVHVVSLHLISKVSCNRLAKSAKSTRKIEATKASCRKLAKPAKSTRTIQATKPTKAKIFKATKSIKSNKIAKSTKSNESLA